MRRDLSRDLEVLDRLPTPDLLEEAERRAAGASERPLPTSRRRVLPRALLSVATVGVAVAAFLWLGSLFRAAPRPRPPAEPVGSNYVVTDLRVDPAGGPEGSILIRFDIGWSGETSPGVHRCVFRLLDARGDVVAHLVRLVLWPRSDNAALDVPGATGTPVDAEASCGPDRLDTPGISDIPRSLVPVVDDEGRIEDFSEELDRRVDEWAGRFSIASMGQTELAANVTALFYARADSVSVDERSVDFHELVARIERLCALVESPASLAGC